MCFSGVCIQWLLWFLTAGSPPPPYQIAVEETEGSGGFDADSNISLFPWRQDIALFIHNLIERSFHGLRASFTQPGYPPTCTPKQVDNSVHSGQRLPTCTSYGGLAFPIDPDLIVEPLELPQMRTWRESRVHEGEPHPLVSCSILALPASSFFFLQPSLLLSLSHSSFLSP